MIRQALIIRNAVLLTTAIALLLVGLAAWGQVPPGGTLCIRSVSATINGQPTTVPLTALVSQAVRVSAGTPGIHPASATGAVSAVSVTLCSGQVLPLVITPDLLAAVSAAVPVPQTQATTAPSSSPASQPDTMPATLPTSGPTSQPATIPTSGPVVVVPPPQPVPSGASFRPMRHVPAGPAPQNGVNTPNGSPNPLTIQGQLYDGFTNGVVVGGRPSFSMVDCVIQNSYRGSSADRYGGQAVFLALVTGPTKFTGCIFLNNGCPPGKPLKEQTQFRHHVYQQFNNVGRLVCDHCTFYGTPDAGLQSRAGIDATDCVFVACGNAFLSVMGHSSMTHCVIYNGSLMAVPGEVDSAGTIGVTSWTGGSAISVQGGPLALNDVQIIGAPGQGGLPTGSPAVPIYLQGAVNVSATWGGAGPIHPEWHADASGLPLLSATKCGVYGWPGKAFVGYSGKGFTTSATTVVYDPLPLIQQVASGQGSLSPEALEERLQSDLRQAVGATP